MARLKQEIKHFLANHYKSSIFIYGVLIALFITLLKYFELQFIQKDLSVELYMAIIAILFTVFGLWLGLKLISIKNTSSFTRNEDALKQLNITKREHEVLLLMAEGLSNQEIADRLFISLATVKSHSSSLFEKLSSQRRTQAINEAKKHKLIP